jgi:hypothetical protein
MAAGRPEPRNKEGFLVALKKSNLVAEQRQIAPPWKKAEFYFLFTYSRGRRDGQCCGGGGWGWEETPQCN